MHVGDELSSPETSEAHTRLSFGRWRPCRFWTGPSAKSFGDANVRQICEYADSLYQHIGSAEGCSCYCPAADIRGD